MKVVSITEMKALEAAAVADGVSGYQLMRRAGEGARAILAELIERYRFRRVVALVGRGNNGGDALVAVTGLPVPVMVLSAGPLSELRGEAAAAAADFPRAIPVALPAEITGTEFRPGDLIVDGLLGTGFSGALRPFYRSAIRAANASGDPIVALDLPSGIHGDSGNAEDQLAIRAEWTITFGFPKRGLFCGDAVRCCGKLRVVPIGLTEAPAATPAVKFTAYTEAEARRDLPRFANDTFKNQRGQLLIAAGSREFTGAAVLVTRAALRAGAGLVRLAVPATPAAPLPAAAIVRILNRGFDTATAAELRPWLAVSTAIAAGSGWGAAPEAAECLKVFFAHSGPLVLDADALNLVSRHPELWQPRPGIIITPHPGEAKRLATAFGIAESTDRIAFARALAAGLGVVTVLKGAFTVVAAPDGETTVNTSGSPALATAGSGDVLTGIIGALAAQRPDQPLRAARLGVFLHGRCGETGGGCGTIADDLPERLPKVWQTLDFNEFFA